MCNVEWRDEYETKMDGECPAIIPIYSSNSKQAVVMHRRDEMGGSIHPGALR